MIGRPAALEQPERIRAEGHALGELSHRRMPKHAIAPGRPRHRATAPAQAAKPAGTRVAARPTSCRPYAALMFWKPVSCSNSIGERAGAGHHAAALPDERGNASLAARPRGRERTLDGRDEHSRRARARPTAAAICRICCSLSATTLAAPRCFIDADVHALEREDGRGRNVRPGHHQVRRERHHFLCRAGSDVKAPRNLERNRCGLRDPASSG